MSPMPIGAPSAAAKPAPSIPAAGLPTTPAPSTPAPTGASKPSTGGPAPSGPAGSSDAAKAAQALVGDIKGLVVGTKALDETWATSALTAKAALETLPKDAKLDDAAKSAIERIMFTGKVLGIALPKDAKPITLDGKQPATEVILGAEQAFAGAVTNLAAKSVDVMKRVPEGVPKEIVQVLGAVRERVTDGLYAIKFSKRIAPPPAPPEKAAPAGAATTAPAPAAPAASPAPTGIAPQK